MPESTQKDRSLVGRLGSVAIGSAFAVGDMVGDGVSAATGAAKGVVDKAEAITEPVRVPLRALGVTNLVMKPVYAVGDRVEYAVEFLDEKGRTGVIQTSGFAIESVGTFIDAALEYLQENPQVDDLIQAQVDKLLPILAESPAINELVRRQVDLLLPLLAESEEIQHLIRMQAQGYLDYLSNNPDALEELIRSQGDDYIDYLNHYPAAVQSLIQGQSMGMAAEIRDEVRERTVTADSAVDVIVRSLLRRTPPDELEPPPEDVRRRAEYARLPSDYVREHRYGRR